MKTLAALCLCLLLGATTHAQELRAEAVNGAVLGGIADAVIGHNSGDLRHNAWRGAAYGAGAGWLIGSIVGDAHDRRFGHAVPVAAYPRTYLYRRGGGYGYRGYGRAADYVYYDAPGYYVGDACYDDAYGYEGTNYAGSGLLLGALAGAVIGHNSGDLRHNGWRGAALGATAGYLLGSIADSTARQRSAVLTARTYAAPAEPTTVADAPVAPLAATVAAAPLAPASPMATANSLFGR